MPLCALFHNGILMGWFRATLSGCPTKQPCPIHSHPCGVNSALLTAGIELAAAVWVVLMGLVSSEGEGEVGFIACARIAHSQNGCRSTAPPGMLAW